MLMLINPHGVLFSISWDDEDMRLASRYKYFILDTDDLSVEQVGYNTLCELVKEKIVNISNVCYDEDVGYRVYFYSMLDYAVLYQAMSLRVGVNGLIVYPTECAFEWGSLKSWFSMRTKELQVYLCAGGKNVCSFKHTEFVDTRLELGYLYQVDNYVIIRMRCILNGMINYDFEVVTVVLSKDGLIDVFFDKHKSDFISKDPAFSAKFVTLMGRRY